MALGRGHVSLHKVSQSRGLELSEPSTPPAPSTGISISHREGCPLRPLIKLLIRPWGASTVLVLGAGSRCFGQSLEMFTEPRGGLTFFSKGNRDNKGLDQGSAFIKTGISPLWVVRPQRHPAPPSSPQGSCLKHLLPHCLSLVNLEQSACYL